VNFFRQLPKDKLQKVILAGIATLIILAVLLHFYVGAQIASLRDSKQQIAKFHKQIDEIEGNARMLEKNKRMREVMTEFLKIQENGMVTGDSFAWLVREMTLLAEQHPIQISSLRPGVETPPQNGRYGVYQTKLDLTGGYDQIGAFVRDLENRFPTAQIRTLQVSDPDAKGDHHVSLDLALLILPPKKSASSSTAEKHS
jgi:Tfp pilus assembly protein PilO